MNSPLKCAVVGVGYFGKFHAQKYAALEETDLVAVSDLNEEVGGACAKENNTKFIKDYRQLLGKIEAVSVATPTSFHYEVTKFFLENGVHVFVEKPITRTSEEAEKLCELAERKNLKLQVNHIERFNPALLSIKNKIKKISFIECRRLSQFKSRVGDVSVILDLMIHDLDLVLSLIQSEVVNVSAVGSPLFTNLIDVSNAHIEFSSGAIASILASRVSDKNLREVTISQPHSHLSLNLQSGEVSLWNKSNPSGPPTQETWVAKKTDALLEGTRSFVHSIQNNKESLISGYQGLQALKLAEKITKNIYGRI